MRQGRREANERAEELAPVGWSRRLLRIAAIVLSVVAGIAYLDQRLQWFDYLEQRAFDWRRGVFERAHGDLAATARQRVVVVLIEDESFQDTHFKHLKQPPLPRDYHAKLIDELTKAGAKVIAFDFLFEKPVPPPPHARDFAAKQLDFEKRVRAEQKLAEAARRSGRVVWACASSPGDPNRLIWPDALLRQASPYVGHTRVPHTGQSALVQRMEAVVDTGVQKVPSFSLEAARLELGLEDAPLRRVPNKLQVGNLSLPVTEMNDFEIHFASDEAILQLPYNYVYNGGTQTEMARENGTFRDKIVVVGDATTLSNDYHETAVGRLPGTVINAYAIATLLQYGLIRQPSGWAVTAVLLLLAAAICVLTTTFRLRYIPLSGVLLISTYLLVNIALFVYAQLALPLVAPALGAVLLLPALLTERGWSEERDRQRVHDVLAHYVSPQIANEGAPTGTVTMLFTDIEGYSALAERYGSSMETALVEQFAILREVARQFHGFEVGTAGDSLFLVFARAPDALHFALEAQLALLRHHWPEPPGRLRVRMGLHTGEPIISHDRNRLTYSGAAANRAARVCAAALGGQILVSRTTYDLVQPGVQPVMNSSMTPAANSSANSSMHSATKPALNPHLTFLSRGYFHLKNIGEEELFQVCHTDLQKDFPPRGAPREP